MAKLIPALVLFLVFLSSCNARSAISSSENEVSNLPAATFSEEDVSDLKPLILLPTDNQLSSVSVPLVNEEKNQPESEKFTVEFQKMDVPAAESGEKKLDWWPMNPHFGRMRSIRCRHHHSRFGGDGQIRPQKEEDEEIHHRRHHHHHGEMFHEGPGVERDERMIGEFKQPEFFFRRHHHHHHHHDDDDDEEDDDDFHHHHHHHHDDDEEDDFHHHHHRRGHGFWRRIRKFMAHF